MTSSKVPTAIVFVRVKDGINHSPNESSSKEDCANEALVLWRAVLNVDAKLQQKAAGLDVYSPTFRTI